MDRMIPSTKVLKSRHLARYGDCSQFGWRIKLHRKYGYHDSDAWYEATVNSLVTDETDWLDVGGGKSIFPYNKQLAPELAERCRSLVVVDPAISHNSLAEETHRCLLEDYDTSRTFNLVTMRMVAEHVERPTEFVAKIESLLSPGGCVVLVTPNKWAPVSMAAAAIPYRWHMPITRFLWKTNDEDVFPTVYKMNTRGTLRDLFSRHGLKEIGFRYCDNTSTLARFKVTCHMELIAWRALQAAGLTYPENNLLGVYQKQQHHCATSAQTASYVVES